MEAKILKKYGGRRRKCKDCGVTFRLAKNRTQKLKAAASQWILDRSTFERIKNKTGVSKMSKWRQVQEYARHISSPLHHYVLHREKASHILVADATFTTVKGKDRAIMIAYDTGIGVVDYFIDVTENATAYSLIFQRLDQAGYRPACVVSDGHDSILSVVRERNLPHQRCIFHLLQELRRKLGKGYENELHGRSRILYSRIKGIFKTGSIEVLPERLERFRREAVPLFRNHPGILRWFWKTLPHAVLHLSYQEKVPNTSNVLENLNSQIKQRLKTMRGMKSEWSLHNLVKILFHFRKYK